MTTVGSLPDFVVIGAPKGGTTSLARWLGAHPQVRMSRRKELEFLDRWYDRGVDWYRAQLPDNEGRYVVGEATPTYLGHPEAPQRAAALMPDAKYVALLREPVSRAWSNYWFFCQLGVERRSWASALCADRDGRSPAAYLERGRYADHLARWDAAVGADRLLVLLFEELQSDPAGVYAQVCRFLGVADDVPPASSASVNPTQRPRSRYLQYALHGSGASRRPLGRRLWDWNAQGGPPPRLSAAEARELRAGFAEDNARLTQRLGRPLPVGWHP